MGLGGLVYHGLNEWIIQLFLVLDGIETLTMTVLGLGDNSYRVFLGLIIHHYRITVDIIAANLTVWGVLDLGMAVRAIACIITRDVSCHFPASLLDLAHLLLKLLHLTLLTAIRSTSIAVIILVDVHT